jgi:hypothetical protein
MQVDKLGDDSELFCPNCQDWLQRMLGYNQWDFRISSYDGLDSSRAFLLKD